MHILQTRKQFWTAALKIKDYQILTTVMATKFILGKEIWYMNEIPSRLGIPLLSSCVFNRIERNSTEQPLVFSIYSKDIILNRSISSQPVSKCCENKRRMVNLSAPTDDSEIKQAFHK